MILSSCTKGEDKILSPAIKMVEQGHFRSAVAELEKITKKYEGTPEGVAAAKEAARVLFFEIKDFKRATDYYKYIVVYSKEQSERLAAQKQIVACYFDQMNDYTTAIPELYKLLPMSETIEDKMDYKMKLARSFFYLNNFQQAQSEVEEFLREDFPEESKFEMNLLKGNISVAKKDLKTATTIFRQLIDNHPDLSIKHNLGVTLSVTLEESKDFKGAIEILEKIRERHPMPEYIDLRLTRLRERSKNQPGARGFRK